MAQSNSQELIWGIVLNYLQKGINIVIALIYTPVMLSMLGKSEYGIYSIAVSLISYVHLLELGLASSYLKFFSQDIATNDREKLAKTNGLFITCFTVIGIIALVVGIVLTCFSQEIFDTGLTGKEHELIKKIMFILAVSMAFNLATTIYSSIIIAYEKFIVHRLLNLIRTVLQPTVVWILLLLGYRSVMLACVTGILTVSVGFFYFYYCVYRIKIPLTFHNLSFAQLKSVSVFSFFVVLNSIFDQFTWGTDSIILGRFVGSGSVAVYSLGTWFSGMYSQTAQAISSVFYPRINRYVAEHQPIEVISNLFIKIGRMQAMIMLPILLGFIVFGRQFISLWAPVGYDDAYFVASITMIPYSIDIMQNVGIAIQMAQNRHKFRSIVCTLLALVHVILSVFVSQKYGAVGCAVVIAVYFTLGPVLIMNWYYKTQIGLDIVGYWQSMAKFLPTILACILVGYVITECVLIQTWQMFVICIIPFLCVYVLMVWFTAMNKDEKDLFVGIYKRMVKVMR